MMKRYAPILLFLGFFAFVYVRSLTFVYVEGDDATSIAYHALGRVRDLQPPYSAYQSMMDAVLGLLPAKEPLLRTFAMTLTSLGAPLLLLLMARLAVVWSGGLIAFPWPVAALLIALLSPEFLYLGLVYTPALLGMSAVVGAHLLVRGRSLGDPRFWISVALFGLGAACRWDVVAYGAIIAADLMIGPGLSGPRSRRVQLAVIWGAAALLSWIAFIAISGYGPRAFLHALRASGPVESFPGIVVVAATLQTLAGPAFILGAVCGLVILIRRRDPLVWLVALGVVLVARYLVFGVPKWLLVSSPGLIACALIGFSFLWSRGTATVRAGLVICIAAPWLIGVHAAFGDSAYGPGFEVQPFDRAAPTRAAIRPVVGPGALVPTSEGPRPVGGHAWILLGSAWRRNVQEAALERTRAIQQATARGIPLLQDLGEGYAVATLAGMGFTTADPWNHLVGNPIVGSRFLTERRFQSTDGTRIDVLRLRDRADLFVASRMDQLRQLAGSGTFVIYGYTSTLRRCYLLAPDSLDPLGATAAVLDLGKLRLKADKMTARTAAPRQ